MCNLGKIIVAQSAKKSPNLVTLMPMLKTYLESFLEAASSRPPSGWPQTGVTSGPDGQTGCGGCPMSPEKVDNSSITS